VSPFGVRVCVLGEWKGGGAFCWGVCSAFCWGVYTAKEPYIYVNLQKSPTYM